MSQEKNLFDDFRYGCVSNAFLLILCVGVLEGCGGDQSESDIAPASTSSDLPASASSGLPTQLEAKSTTSEALDSTSSNHPPRDDKPAPSGPGNKLVGAAQGEPASIENAAPAQLREAALRALGQGQDDVAFELVRQVMRVQPGHPQAVFLQALVLGDRNRFHEAIKILDDLAAQTPATRLPALGQTAEWLVLAGEFDEAVIRYRSILDEVPSSPMVHHHLGQLLMQLGNRTEGALHFRYLSQFGELDQEELRALLAISTPLPQDAVSGRFEPMNRLARARKEMSLARLDAAVEIIQSEGALSDAEASLRARIYAAQDDFEAVRQWASSRELFESDSDGWFALGCLAASEQNHSEAIQSFSKALLIDQTDAQAYQMLSQSLLAIGDKAAAEETSKRADLIRQTPEIGDKLTIDKSGDRARIAKLVLLLEQLKRPLEVLGWRSIDLVYAVTEAKMTEPEAGVVYNAIVQKREQLMESGDFRVDSSFILCGLDTDN